MHADYEEYCIRSMCELNHNTVSIVVDPPGAPPAWRPSCFARIYADDAAVFRAYTPVSAHTSAGLRFAIKLYRDGTLSEHIRKKRVGDRLRIAFPVEKRPYIENEFRHILMVAGGTGVTPMMQILEHRCLSATDTTMFTLLFCNRTRADVFLEDLLGKYRAFCDVVYLFDSLAETDAHGTRGETRYAISADVLKGYARDRNGRQVDFVYVSGPGGMLEAVCGAKELGGQGKLGGILKDLGFCSESVYKL